MKRLSAPRVRSRTSPRYRVRTRSRRPSVAEAGVVVPSIRLWRYPSSTAHFPSTLRTRRRDPPRSQPSRPRVAPPRVSESPETLRASTDSLQKLQISTGIPSRQRSSSSGLAPTLLMASQAAKWSAARRSTAGTFYPRLLTTCTGGSSGTSSVDSVLCWLSAASW